MSEELGPPQLIDELNTPHDSSRVFKDLLAGTAGGIAQVLVGQPFDTTKVRLQTSSTPTTAVQVVKNLIKNEGLRGFYKGTLTPLVGVGACVSCQFGVNEAMKRFFRGPNSDVNKPLTLPQYYVCGLAGGIANSFLASPIEHVRIRLQTQTSSGTAASFKGPLDCIKKLKSNGALMRGLTPTVLREAQGCATYFLTYEALVANEVQKGLKRSDVPAWKLCMFGAISGVTLWLMVYPIDVVKSIMQTDNLQSPVHGRDPIVVAKKCILSAAGECFSKVLAPQCSERRQPMGRPLLRSNLPCAF